MNRKQINQQFHAIWQPRKQFDFDSFAEFTELCKYSKYFPQYFQF